MGTGREKGKGKWERGRKGGGGQGRMGGWAGRRFRRGWGDGRELGSERRRGTGRRIRRSGRKMD